MCHGIHRHRLPLGRSRQPRRCPPQGAHLVFESCEAWRTVLKLGLTVTAIAMAWLIDSCVLDFMQLNVARLFTGFTCGVELWSFLENAAQLSDAPLFHWLRRYVRRRIRKEAGDE